MNRRPLHVPIGRADRPQSAGPRRGEDTAPYLLARCTAARNGRHAEGGLHELLKRSGQVYSPLGRAETVPLLGGVRGGFIVPRHSKKRRGLSMDPNPQTRMTNDE